MTKQTLPRQDSLTLVVLTLLGVFVVFFQTFFGFFCLSCGVHFLHDSIEFPLIFFPVVLAGGGPVPSAQLDGRVEM